MLDSKTIKKINEFIYSKPRTVQEIAQLIGKSWRTADSYVERIEKETGSIATRVFREGTKGALKVVFWNNVERIHSSEFQEWLFKRIESGRKKQDFSPFDIWQHIDKNKKRAFLKDADEKNEEESESVFADLFNSCESQLLVFSGNLSWINASFGKKSVIDSLKELAKRKITIKMISRVGLESTSNIKKVFEINDNIGIESIEVRHCEQPLRGMIVDKKIARFKEIKNPEGYKKSELEKKCFICYDIYDEDWIEWLQKVFWNLFRNSIDAKKRLDDMSAIMKLE